MGDFCQLKEDLFLEQIGVLIFIDEDQLQGQSGRRGGNRTEPQQNGLFERWEVEQQATGKSVLVVLAYDVFDLSFCINKHLFLDVCNLYFLFDEGS